MEEETLRRTASRLPHYLGDILFPCSRREILEWAEDNDAPDVLLDAIEGLPNRRYFGIDEILSIISCTACPGNEGANPDTSRQ